MKSTTRLLYKALPQTLINFDYPDPTRVLGLSTSHWTDVVDWNVARDNGIKFAYIKAMNGVNTVNFWKQNYEGAKKAGIKVGGYTWLYPPSVVSPGTQARVYARFIKDYPCDLPWCVDFEWTKPSNPNSGDLCGFVKPFEDETGKKPAIYTAPGYWNEYGTKNSYWAEYPLWQAQYNKGLYDVIKPWRGYEFLQWTEVGKGTDYGVPTYGEKACELNYYYGTLEQFEAKYGDTPNTAINPPIEIPTEIPTGDIMIVKARAVAEMNLKPTVGGDTLVKLPVGGYVFGERGLTDIVGFTRYYKPDGTRVELGAKCKMSIGKSVITLEKEPIIPTEPIDPVVPPTTPTKVAKTLTITFDDGSFEVYDLVKKP